MAEFFTEHPLAIVCAVIIIVMIIISIIKSSIRLLIAAGIILVLLTLFTWAPQKLNEYLGGDEAQSFSDALGDTTSEVTDYVSENAGSWFDWLFGGD